MQNDLQKGVFLCVGPEDIGNHIDGIKSVFIASLACHGIINVHQLGNFHIGWNFNGTYAPGITPLLVFEQGTVVIHHNIFNDCIVDLTILENFTSLFQKSGS